jgi:hypothetical protein
MPRNLLLNWGIHWDLAYTYNLTMYSKFLFTEEKKLSVSSVNLKSVMYFKV